MYPFESSRRPSPRMPDQVGKIISARDYEPDLRRVLMGWRHLIFDEKNMEPFVETSRDPIDILKRTSRDLKKAVEVSIAEQRSLTEEELQSARGGFIEAGRRTIVPNFILMGFIRERYRLLSENPDVVADIMREAILYPENPPNPI